VLSIKVNEYTTIDSTIVRVHQHAAGARGDYKAYDAQKRVLDLLKQAFTSLYRPEPIENTNVSMTKRCTNGTTLSKTCSKNSNNSETLQQDTTKMQMHFSEDGTSQPQPYILIDHTP
jgi:hypothetical protein